MSPLSILNIIILWACLSGCGHGPAAPGEAPNGNVLPPDYTPTQEQPVLPPPSVVNNPAPSPIQLTYYSLTDSRNPQPQGTAHTYTSTGSCVVYLTSTYCWDDGIKQLLGFGANPQPIGDYSYWNLGQWAGSAGTWGVVSGTITVDFMLAPRFMSHTVGVQLGGTSGITRVLTTGTPHPVSCQLTGLTLACGDFSIDLNQTPLQ